MLDLLDCIIRLAVMILFISFRYFAISQHSRVSYLPHIERLSFGNPYHCGSVFWFWK